MSLKLAKKTSKKYRLMFYRIVEISFIVSWLINIKESDSLYMPYLLVGIFAILCCCRRIIFGRQNHWILAGAFSIILTTLVCIANYSIFPSISSLKTFLLDALTYINMIFGGFFAFYNIFSYFPNLITLIKPYAKQRSPILQIRPCAIFFISFGIIALVYLVVFFTCKYPGNLSFDSINQIKQTLVGEYSNHHPFIHTIIIGIFINFGKNIFGDINTGVALYSIFQILLMSLIFAYAITAILQKSGSKIGLIIILIIYALSPYHIMYSMTVWKDVVFAGSVLAFVVTEYRIYQHIGKKYLNYVLLALSGFCACVFKGNGFIIILIFTIISTILCHKEIFKTKELLLNPIVLVVVIISAFVYNQSLTAFGVSPTETMESLSVPAQQIARVAKETKDFTNEQFDLLSNISDLDLVSEKYTPWISDPIKEQVWESRGGEQYLKEHRLDFIKLYFDLGFSHPYQYITAWADQTKGYFNGGYNYWVLSNDITVNDLGISKAYEGNIPDKIFNSYLSIFEDNLTLRIIYCIGFTVWLVIGLLYISIIKRDKTNLLLTIVPLLVIFTLLLAAPVFSEFRYAYPLFCCLPFLFATTFASLRQQYFK